MSLRIELDCPPSPSDKMLSPCSKRLLKNRKRKNNTSQIIKQTYTLEEQVRPHSCPVGNMRLILGTASTGRKTVMDNLGWTYEQLIADIDEKAIRHNDPMEMPILIAKAKASALIKRHGLMDLTEPALLITCDQIVLFKTTIREKPENREQAVEFLSSYSNEAVSTVSAVVVTHLPSGIQESGVDIATVYWNHIPDEVVQRVVDRGEIFNSAGGFKVTDSDLGPLVKGLDRPVASVTGLPIDLLARLMIGTTRTAALESEAKAAGVVYITPLLPPALLLSEDSL